MSEEQKAEAVSPKRDYILKRYWIAVWTVAVTFVITILISPLVPPDISSLFLVAVMVSAWRGGLAVGLFATLLSVLIDVFIFLPPTASFSLDNDDFMQLIVDVVAAVVVGTLSAAQSKAENERRRLLLLERSARIEAEKANEVKDEFLAAVSHELRTPLSVVVGFVYLLLNQVIGKLSEEQQKVLETVYRNSEELLELIDNVLWMTSLSSGDSSPVLEKFDAREIIDETVKRYQRTIGEKNLSLTIDIPEGGVSIISDRSKVERIFQNIFNNAVKFTSVGEIRVKARVSADRGILDLEVSDTGIGIDKSKMDSVFELA